MGRFLFVLQWIDSRPRHIGILVVVLTSTNNKMGRQIKRGRQKDETDEKIAVGSQGEDIKFTSFQYCTMLEG